jgi:hypothetical protein
MGTFLFPFLRRWRLGSAREKENRSVPYSFLTGLLRHGDTAVQ